MITISVEGMKISIGDKSVESVSNKPKIDISKLPKDKQDKAKSLIQKELDKNNKLVGIACGIIKKFVSDNKLGIKLNYFKEQRIDNFEIVKGNFFQYYVRIKPIDIDVAYGSSKEVFDGYELKFNDLEKELNAKLGISSAYASCKNLTEGSTFRIGFELKDPQEIKL